MEPLEIMENNSTQTKKSDRATLNNVEAKKIDRWLAQINTASKGFLALTKSDMVNFLARIHPDELNPKELRQIRQDHYDPMRHIGWITPQLKMALANNDLARVAELQEELRGIELSVVTRAMDGLPVTEHGPQRRPRAPRKNSKKVEAKDEPEPPKNSAETMNK